MFVIERRNSFLLFVLLSKRIIIKDIFIPDNKTDGITENPDKY